VTRSLAGVALLIFCVAPLMAQQVAPSDTGVKLTNQDVFELSLAMASEKPPSACIELIVADAKTAVTAPAPHLLENHLSFLQDQLCTTYLILSSDQFKAAIKANGARALGLTREDIEQIAVRKLKAMSQQDGSSSGTGGSTNLTSKGMTSKVLSVASEYGALTQSVSGQTTTVQGTFAGVPLVLLGKGLLVDCKTKIFAITPCVSHKVVDELTNFSYSASFENNPNSTTASGTAVGGPTNGMAQQVNVSSNTRSISAFSFKWVAISKRPSEADLTKSHTNVYATAAAQALDAAITTMANLQIGLSLTADSPYRVWLAQQGAILYAAAQEDSTGVLAEKTWEGLADSFAAALGVPQGVDEKKAADSPVLVAAMKLGAAYNAYLGTEESISDNLAVPPVLSLEYDDNRPASQPSNSVFRGIFQMKVKPVTLTINGAISVYNSDQSAVVGASRLRDAQFAAEGAHDFSLKTPFSTSSLAATLSGAFYFQYQNSPAILNVTPGTPVDGVVFTGLPSTATKVYAQKGNLAIGQIKLTIGSGSSVKVPVSVTYSNRTELVTNPTWKAQIGVSYDFDSLFAKH
jgi:hypothetical protein